MGTLLVLATSISFSITAFINIKNAKTSSKLLEIADSIIDDKKSENNDSVIEEEVFSIENINQDEDIIGKLIISAIDVEAPIKEGTSQDVLKDAIGHFSNTKYWNGNVCLASHNRGTYAHYFENLNKLNTGDTIKYSTKVGTRIYEVKEIKEISEQDLTVLNNTDRNCLTLITCIKNKPKSRLCVKAIEI